MDKYHFGLNLDLWDFADLTLKQRFIEALNKGIACYPIYRHLRFAARTELELLFDDLALNLGLQAQRLNANSIILDGEGIFISGHGGRKSDYCSCFFGIWGNRLNLITTVKQQILDCVATTQITDPMFSIDWHFLTAKGELESASIEEMADDILYDQAYPKIPQGVNAFIQSYLTAPETVLVLQGAPGTGKTRLIRAILGEISKRKGGEAQALYTGDKKALESDEIFVKFITGWEDAFVVEDADHLLKPRADGNEHLHRFLAIADGVIRAQGRKIIFSTNLSNVRDLDEALIRPGRCFSRVWMPLLSKDESLALIKQLCQAEKLDFAVNAIENNQTSSFSLAKIYNIVKELSKGNEIDGNTN